MAVKNAPRAKDRRSPVEGHNLPHLLSAGVGPLVGPRDGAKDEEPPGRGAAFDRRARSTWGYLRDLGAPDIPASSHPVDPGYDPHTLAGHLAQSSHLMASLQISNACWLVARQDSTREKIAAARRRDVPVVTDSGPFEIATRMGKLEDYLALCADMGVSRVEAGAASVRTALTAREIVRGAEGLGLSVQFRLEARSGEALGAEGVEALISHGLAWLDAGAELMVIEAREGVAGIGLFGRKGSLNRGAADRFAKAFGLEKAVFESPTKAGQIALIRHLGREVGLGNVRLEDLLSVEIFRRGLHAEAFDERVFRRDTPFAHRTRSRRGADDGGRAGSVE